MPDLCQPCHERGVERVAKLRLDGTAVCNACARGGDAAGVRAQYSAERAAEAELMISVRPEPRLVRRGPVYPRHLSQEEREVIVELPPVTAPAVLVLPKQFVIPSDIPFATHRCIRTILAETAREFNLQASDLMNRSRALVFARPRQIAMLLIRRHTPLSLKQVARTFGDMHHTSVMAACRVAEISLAMDSTTAKQIKAIDGRVVAAKSGGCASLDQTNWADGMLQKQSALYAGMRDVMDLMQAGAA